MNNPTFVILWDGAVLICIDVPNSLIPPNVILDHYAQHYAFDRKRLQGTYVDLLSWEEFNQAKPV